MAISDDAAAIAASNLVIAHATLATTAAKDGSSRAPTYEQTVERMGALFTLYFETVQRAAIHDDGPPLVA